MMDQRVVVSIAAVVSAVAAGVVAVAVSYRLWGADVADSERRIDAVNLALAAQTTDCRAEMKKVDSVLDAITDATKEIAKPAKPKEWWCMYLVLSTGPAPTDGICYPDRKMCDDTRIAALDKGERSAPCIKQGSAVCVGLSRSRGAAREDKCWATPKGCIDDAAWIEKNGGTILETCRRE